MPFLCSKARAVVKDLADALNVIFDPHVHAVCKIAGYLDDVQEVKKIRKHLVESFRDAPGIGVCEVAGIENVREVMGVLKIERHRGDGKGRNLIRGHLCKEVGAAYPGATAKDIDAANKAPENIVGSETLFGARPSDRLASRGP